MEPIPRNLAPVIRDLARQYPVITVTGPRQSGKTTLCRAEFPDHRYVNLERLDQREYARTDPRGLLAECADGAVFDEVQHVPELLSWLQVEVDERGEPGRFVVTGSQHLGLSEAVSQSLAGRAAVLHLLPLSHDEVRRFEGPRRDLIETLWTGSYPRIHQRGLDPARWYADYVTTYVQRDVRSVRNVGDLQTFTGFVRLAAGRTAETVNLSSLGGDAGVSHNTARAWLSILETGFLVHRLPAWHHNLTKRVTRAPKLHFYDTGLLCQLLGIGSAEQLRHHPLRGAIFETWVVSEVLKSRVHAGLPADLHHFRDRRGLEVDLVVERGDLITLVETKSGATLGRDFFKSLWRLATTLQPTEWRRVEQRLVYGGDERQRRTDVEVLPWQAVAAVDWS